MLVPGLETEIIFFGGCFGVFGLVFGVAFLLDYLVARSSGWALLVRSYRASDSFAGNVQLIRDCRIARMNWGGFTKSLAECWPSLPADIPEDDVAVMGHSDLILGANPTGLYLRPTYVLRVYNPLFIPWSDVVVTMSQPKTNLLTLQRPEWMTFRFRQAPTVLLQIQETEESRRLVAAAAEGWPGLSYSPWTDPS